MSSSSFRSERRKRSKKMPPPIAPKSDPAETAKKRRAAEELRRTKLETEIIDVPVPPEACKCPRCGGDDVLRRVGSKPSTVYEYVPSYFRRRIFNRETRSCTCGYIVLRRHLFEKHSRRLHDGHHGDGARGVSRTMGIIRQASG